MGWWCVMSHTTNALIFSHYHFKDSMKKQKYGKALRYFEIFLNVHDRLEASAKAHTQQQEIIVKNLCHARLDIQGTQDIIVNYEMSVLYYEERQTDMPIVLNRMTGCVYNIIER
jgi:hypothetical protein